MATLRQLKIKTGSCARFCKDLAYYIKDVAQNESKLQEATEQKSDDKSLIRRCQEFVAESVAAQQDVKERLHEAYHELQQFVEQHRGDDGVADSEALTKADAVLASTHALMSGDAGVVDERREEGKGRSVTVFGASRAQPGDDLYALSEALGAALAERGYGILSGGYKGCMEGVSKGAAAGGAQHIEGVITASAFPDRGDHGNEYLTHTTRTSSLQDRFVKLSLGVDAYVALPGTMGTLTELVMAWNCVTVNGNFGKQPFRPIIAWRQPWEASLKAAIAPLGDGVSEEDWSRLTFVDSVEECVAALAAQLKR